jgi:hypothetical protein
MLLVVLLAAGALGVVGLGLAAAGTLTGHPAAPAGREPATGGATTGTGATTGSDASSAGAGEGAGQASAINDLLTASGASRATLGTAISEVRSCDFTADPLSTMDTVNQARTGQVRTAQGLAIGDLPGGENLRDLLVQLLRKSAEADGDYQAWAQRVAGSDCALGAGAAQLTAADTASSAATTLKKTFLTAWNPIAARYQLPQRKEPDI